MKRNLVFLLLLFPAMASFLSCKKYVDFCKCNHYCKDSCPPGGGPDTASFATKAKLKLDSFTVGQIGTKIGEINQFATVTYKRPETYGTWIGGGTLTNIYDLNGGWQVIKYSDYAGMDPDAYLVYKEGETIPVTSTICGGTINLRKTYMFIPPGRQYYTTAGWELISNQTLIFDENHPLPYDDNLICNSGKVNAASNESWAIYFSFY